MPHYFDSGFSVRQPMWHGLGTVLENHPTDVAATCKSAGLDWEVALRPLFAATEPSQPSQLVEVPGKSAIVRLDRAHAPEGILGITTPRYTPVQNEQVIEFCFDLLEAGRADGQPVQMETAGALMQGRLVWCLARLKELDLVIPRTDDVSRGYLVVSAGHDGEHAFKAAITSVRVVCWNTLSMALRKAQSTFTIRHVGDPLDRMQEAAATLGLAAAWTAEFRELAIWLAGQQLDTSSLSDFLDQVFPMPNQGTETARTRAMQARDSITHLFETTGSQIKGIAGTRWAALQAVTEYSDWYVPVRSRGDVTQQDRRFLRTVIDPDNGLKRRALETLIRT